MTTNCITHKTSLCPGYNVIFIFGFVHTLFISPIMIVFVSRNLISTPQKIWSIIKRRNNRVMHGTILCPGYKMNKFSFCKVFLQWVLHMVVFYCRNLISNPFQKVKLVNNRINTFVKVETIFCPGYEVIKTCFCKIFF